VRILLVGRNGQVGHELEKSLCPLGEVVACDREKLDLLNADSIVDAMRSIKPNIVVNAAAYTAVDKAESEPEIAQAVNTLAPAILAEEARKASALLIHYSTDYVFDGTRKGPYVETDAVNPLSVYGRTKLDGELAVQATDCRHLILRTSWVYGPRGKNFMLTILRLAKEKDELRVVNDQIGGPTTAEMIADATTRIIASRRTPEGLFHMSGAGSTSWYGFAEAIVRGCSLRTRVVPIPTSGYPTPAKRPANSVLSNEKLKREFGISMEEWQTGLNASLASLASVTG
jgi:dTDP-4-dehydrorhamnose reductase